MLKTELADEAATVAWGQRLGAVVKNGGVIYLQGDLGAGKTTFTRGVLRAFGHHGAVKSPTYTLVEPYHFGAINVYHFDLYRLVDPEELELIGVRDYFSEQALVLVEWPSRGEPLLPAPDLTVSLSPASAGSGRLLSVQANSEVGQRWLLEIT
jgi:tRNA threonylcarbamoyladenosine biosynthesis protein TsaE